MSAYSTIYLTAVRQFGFKKNFGLGMFGLGTLVHGIFNKIIGYGIIGYGTESVNGNSVCTV